ACAAVARSAVCALAANGARAAARASGVGVLYSCKLSHVPQSGHLPIHLGWTLPQELQRNWLRTLAIAWVILAGFGRRTRTNPRRRGIDEGESCETNRAHFAGDSLVRGAAGARGEFPAPGCFNPPRRPSVRRFR